LQAGKRFEASGAHADMAPVAFAYWVDVFEDIKQLATGIFKACVHPVLYGRI
jgi:hypothetical protein